MKTHFRMKGYAKETESNSEIAYYLTIQAATDRNIKRLEIVQTKLLLTFLCLTFGRCCI